MITASLPQDHLEAAVTKFNELYQGLVDSGQDFDSYPKDYEDAVIELVVEAWGPDEFQKLINELRVAVVKAVLSHEQTEGGWYTGNLPHPNTINATLRRTGWNRLEIKEEDDQVQI